MYQRIEDLTTFAVPEQPALSPDGNQVVYVLRTVVRGENSQTWTPVTFYQMSTGERYLHFGVRATPRVD